MGSSVEIAVVGGGLTGTLAAILSARSGARTLHLAPPAPQDPRTSALMRPSILFLEHLGLFESGAEPGLPLRQIRLIDATRRLLRAPEILFDAREAGLEAFGWNIANASLMERFEAAEAGLSGLERRGARLLDATHEDGRWHLVLDDGTTVTADLLIGADGRDSRTRELAGIKGRKRRLGESALVCDLELERPLGACSVEFHYPDGPFTLVPAGGNRANLVWIDKDAALAEAGEGEGVLEAALAAKSMRLFGAIRPVTPARIFPLFMLDVPTAGTRATALVGEAAHAFPPIGAQGLNLGLRDLEALEKGLRRTDRGETGWAERLAADYGRDRALDLRRTGAFVGTLYGSLLSGMLPAQALRMGGLWALKALPPLRRHAFALGMGGKAK